MEKLKVHIYARMKGLGMEIKSEGICTGDGGGRKEGR